MGISTPPPTSPAAPLKPPASGTLFPIVGIGASAGGLEAVGELLKNLPADIGMAFIFVQHLAPNHISMLTEILSKKTAMPVTEAIEGAVVEINHVYIIPPNTTMTIADGRLELRPRNDTLGIPMPIDDLFHSLANDQGPNAIGISLSGAGTDGALGMQSIKSEGGITFAQDEKSAQYNSMPRAAVALGGVDFVLPPKAIAEELVRIGRQPLRGDQLLSDRESLGEADLKKIFQLLHNTCNLDFTHYKRGTIKRRLARRLTVHNFSNIPDYIKFLGAHPEEVKALGQDFLIHVTSFFRDAETFENLFKYVFPRMVEGLSPKVPLRIWIPGCSTGEEVYSIAMCCLEYLSERAIGTQIQIFGTDVSEAALQTARAGIYVENIARNVSPQRLERFFIKTDDHYQVARSVRDLCIFARHDVTSDPPFSRLDLISCRNLLIYLDPLLQKRVLPLFHYALKPEGTLILGPAENIGGFADIFTVHDNKKIKFYIKKSLPAQSQLKYLEDYPGKAGSGDTRSSSRFPSNAPLKKKYSEAEQQKREADRITLNHYAPAAVICDKSLNVLEFRGDTSPFLTQPSGAPDINLQKLAKPGLLVEITKAIQKAGNEGMPVRKTGLQAETSGGNKELTIEVIPLQRLAAEEGRFLIFFEDENRSMSGKKMPGFWKAFGRLILQELESGTGKAKKDGKDSDIIRLKRELDDTRDHIRFMTEEHEVAKEELQASQEELLSSNEEFQSTNEELETAKEELQSANEELLTTNEEIRERNRELGTLNDKLKEALNYAETIIKTVTQPFLVLDGDLHIVRANPAFYNTFMTTPEATEQRLLYDLGDKQWDIRELRQFLQALISKDTSFKNYEITHVFPNVGKKTMRLNGTHLAWEEKPQILLAIEDVSDYRTALDTLKDNDRRKNEFLAMLAHELRNPLAPIRNALEIWKHGDAGEKAEKQSQLILERQLKKMVRIIDDLLDVSRITRGVIVLKKEHVDLAQLLRQSIEGVRPRLEERQHELSVSLPQEKIFVKGDVVRLEQIVSNLLINAAKYTEPGGRIEVALEQEEGDALIRVSDNGIGISPELLPHIFDLFVQAERSLDRKQGGLGIGLTLVRRLVELQGGTVHAKSPGLKKGSEFIVRLPLIPESEVVSSATSDVPRSAPFIARRILIVDDNVDAAQTTQMLLELKGHKVEAATDGPSGLKAALAFKPEVILLDIGLPEMDGYEVARHLRALPETKNVMLIALSGYGQAEDLRKSKEAGFDHHLVKPADMTQLLDLISEEREEAPHAGKS
jgi:two-component system CheB/CheR fusion protein